MFIRIDENGTLTTSADEKQYNIVFGKILLIVYSIISVILLAIGLQPFGHITLNLKLPELPAL